jgi:hypothetical protein
MRNFCMLCFFSLTAILGCAELIRVDAETYMRNPSMYEGQYILIAATLEEVLEHYPLFQGLDIETAAPITHFEGRDAPSWFVTLEKDGNMIRAYEDTYPRLVPSDADYLARWAKQEGGTVTARGKLMAGGLELDQLTYGNLIVSTNVLSSAA